MINKKLQRYNNKPRDGIGSGKLETNGSVGNDSEEEEVGPGFAKKGGKGLSMKQKVLPLYQILHI